MDEIQPPPHRTPHQDDRRDYSAAAPDPRTPQGQARRYLEARYGRDVWFRAPETFGPFEQWVHAVASGHDEQAEKCMTAIEEHFREVLGT